MALQYEHASCRANVVDRNSKAPPKGSAEALNLANKAHQSTNGQISNAAQDQEKDETNRKIRVVHEKGQCESDKDAQNRMSPWSWFFWWLKRFPASYECEHDFPSKV